VAVSLCACVCVKSSEVALLVVAMLMRMVDS